MNRITALLMLLAAIGLTDRQAQADVPITGTILDSTVSAPIEYGRVEIRQQMGGSQNPSTDPVLQVVYADVMGNYNASAPDGIDVYVLAKWEFALLPGAFYNNKVVRLLGKGSTSPVPYTEKASLTFDTTGLTLLIIDVTMDQVKPVGMSALYIEIQLTLDYIRLNKGSVAWNPNYDVPVHIRTDDQAFFDCTDEAVSIEEVSFNGSGTTFDRITLFHEVGHLIHHHHNSNATPDPCDDLPAYPDSCGCHSVNTEELPTCAIVEAWPTYLGQLIAELSGIFDPFYFSYRDPFFTHWRGGGFINLPPDCTDSPSDSKVCIGGSNEGSSCTSNFNCSGGVCTLVAPTAYDAGMFESGENIEGAVAGALFAIDDSILFSFETNFRVMVQDKPDHIFEFSQAFPTYTGGADTLGTLTMHSRMQDHGLVYSRARFKADPIAVDEPPDVAAVDEGNAKEIDGVLFLRGNVPAGFEAVSAADLGVQQVVSIAEVALTYQPAIDGLNDNALFTLEGAFVNFSAGMIDIDTTTFPGTGDGDWDLLVVGKNTWGFRDSFLPAWGGDGNPLANTDEKYLKRLGAWYDKDRNPRTPSTNPAKEGKVIVDNTAPTVEHFMPVP